MTIKSHIKFLGVTALCLGFALSGASDLARAQQIAKAGDNDDAEEDSDRDDKFSFDASAGIEYDSNVSVIDVDLNTAAGDAAAVLDAGIDYESEIAEETEINVGYNFSQSLHFDFTGFDIQTHRATVGIDHDFGGVKGALTYIFVHSQLGGAGFLSFHRVSPAVSGFLGKNVFVRGVYEYTDKDFKNRVDRDSTVHAAGVTAFIFLDGTTTYITTGYKFEDENAVDPQFDYKGHNLRARITHKFRMGNADLVFKTGWRYEKRNYSSVTPSIGMIRGDDRHKIKTSLEIPVTAHVYVELEHEYNNFSSNLPAANFNQNLLAFRVGGRF